MILKVLYILQQFLFQAFAQSGSLNSEFQAQPLNAEVHNVAELSDKPLQQLDIIEEEIDTRLIDTSSSYIQETMGQGLQRWNSVTSVVSLVPTNSSPGRKSSDEFQLPTLEEYCKDKRDDESIPENKISDNNNPHRTEGTLYSNELIKEIRSSAGFPPTPEHKSSDFWSRPPKTRAQTVQTTSTNILNPSEETAVPKSNRKMVIIITFITIILVVLLLINISILVFVLRNSASKQTVN